VVIRGVGVIVEVEVRPVGAVVEGQQHNRAEAAAAAVGGAVVRGAEAQQQPVEARESEIAKERPIRSGVKMTLTRPPVSGQHDDQREQLGKQRRQLGKK